MPERKKNKHNRRADEYAARRKKKTVKRGKPKKALSPIAPRK